MSLKKQLESPCPGPHGAMGAQASQGMGVMFLSSGVVTYGFHVNIAAPGSWKGTECRS